MTSQDMPPDLTSFAVREDLRSIYDEYYLDERTLEWRRLGAVDKAANIVSLCQAVPHQTILDIGCGEGSVLVRLAELDFGGVLHGLEISRTALDAVLARAIPRLAGCEMFDGYRIPHADGAFDLAILNHVIEHVEHPRKLLYEAARVARHVFIEVPLEDNLRLPSHYVPSKVGHINVYSIKTFRMLVETSGLAILAEAVTCSSKEVYRFQAGWKGALARGAINALHRVAPRMAERVFCYHASLLCRPGQSVVPTPA
jgi:SAM-dependent methyltransferase